MCVTNSSFGKLIGSFENQCKKNGARKNFPEDQRVLLKLPPDQRGRRDRRICALITLFFEKEILPAPRKSTFKHEGDALYSTSLNMTSK